MTFPSEAPDTLSVTQPAEPAEAAAESERILSLKATDSKVLTSEIRRLERESEDFRAVLTNEVGRKAERQYKPEIAKRDSEIAELRLQLRRHEYEAMTESEINTKFASDPIFAREYTEVVHHKPQAAPPPDEEPLIIEAFENMELWAKRQGISDEAWDVYTSQAANGKYIPPDGNWRTAMGMLQQDVTTALLEMHKKPTPAPEVTEPSKPDFNAALTTGGPDLSTRTANAANQKSWPQTRAQWDKLTSAGKQSILDADGGAEHVRKIAVK